MFILQTDAADGSVDWKTQAKGVFQDIKASPKFCTYQLDINKSASYLPNLAHKALKQLLAEDVVISCSKEQVETREEELHHHQQIEQFD